MTIKQFMANFNRRSSSRLVQDMKAYNIKGRRVCAESCPIHNLISTELSKKGIGVEFISVNSGNTLFMDASRRMFTVPNSKAIEQFVIDFDAGKYPQLVK